MTAETYAYIMVGLIFIIVIYVVLNTPEHLTDTQAPVPTTTEVAAAEKAVVTNPNQNFYIRLYEGFEYNDLQAEYTDSVRNIIKLNLKSYEISLPKLGTSLDSARKVELWSVDDGANDNIASSVSGLYNSYLEPEEELRANPARYQNIVTVRPGQTVRANLRFPVKKVYVISVI